MTETNEMVFSFRGAVHFVKFLWNKVNPRQFGRNAVDFDVAHNIPRPSLEQHLPSDKAMQRFLERYLRLALIIFACVVSALLLFLLAIEVPNIAGLRELAFIVAFLVPFVVFQVDFVEHFEKPYSPRARRVTYGSAHFATIPELEEKQILSRASVNPLPERVPLGPYNQRHWISLPIADLCGSTAFFGKPRSGKTETFMVNQARAWAQVGGAFILDVKGDIYEQTASYFTDVYRIDFQDPDKSDYLPFLDLCKGDITFTSKLANEIAGKDSGKGSDPFWANAASDLIRCILLQLPYMPSDFPAPTPSSVYNFLSVGSDVRGLEKIVKDGKVSYVAPDVNAMLFEQGEKPDEIHAFIQNSWNIYSSRIKAEQTLGGIIANATAMLQEFREPNVVRPFTPPTWQQQRLGRKTVDFRKLRNKGTAIYLVVSVEQAERLGKVIGTVISILMETLIRFDQGSPVLLQLDEAGNIRINGISEFIGICRGKRVAPVFAFQNLSQLFKNYGKEYAESVLGTIRTKIALPGVDDETAEYFSQLCGKCTTVERKVTDRPGNQNDSVEDREVGRNLMDPNEIRALPEFRQALVITGNVAPFKVAFPPRGVVVDPVKVFPTDYGTVTTETFPDVNDEYISGHDVETLRMVNREVVGDVTVESQLSENLATPPQQPSEAMQALQTATATLDALPPQLPEEPSPLATPVQPTTIAAAPPVQPVPETAPEQSADAPSDAPPQTMASQATVAEPPSPDPAPPVPVVETAPAASSEQPMEWDADERPTESLPLGKLKTSGNFLEMVDGADDEEPPPPPVGAPSSFKLNVRAIQEAAAVTAPARRDASQPLVQDTAPQSPKRVVARTGFLSPTPFVRVGNAER